MFGLKIILIIINFYLTCIFPYLIINFKKNPYFEISYVSYVVNINDIP